MPWYLIAYNAAAPSEGSIVRADEIIKDAPSCNFLRDGLTVFTVPLEWIAQIEEFPTQQGANVGLKELRQARNRFRAAATVEERVLIIPPRQGEKGTAGGLIESSGVSIKLSDLTDRSASAAEQQPPVAPEAPPAPAPEKA